ncbi:Histidinol-phosphate aminotransferase [Bienertia sinuspersici]
MRIAKLEILIEDLENEVKNLKQANGKLEDDVAEMTIENTEQLSIGGEGRKEGFLVVKAGE